MSNLYSTEAAIQYIPTVESWARTMLNQRSTRVYVGDPIGFIEVYNLNVIDVEIGQEGIRLEYPKVWFFGGATCTGTAEGLSEDQYLKYFSKQRDQLTDADIEYRRICISGPLELYCECDERDEDYGSLVRHQVGDTGEWKGAGISRPRTYVRSTQVIEYNSFWNTETNLGQLILHLENNKTVNLSTTDTNKFLMWMQMLDNDKLSYYIHDNELKGLISRIADIKRLKYAFTHIN